VKEWRLTSTSAPQTAQNVQGEEIEGGQLTVKISPSAAEVLASYTIDTQTLEVSITLSPTYPLSPPNVTGIKRVGMSEKQYLSIIRATKSTIALHGGSLVDGLSLFEKNLNAHFSGVGECTICYSILSLQDGSLPGKKCGVCKNGFHAGCLFKWFKSTNQSSCPLCRTSWQF
jgi:E3 ubiquitin-protein ligase listerin